MSVINRNMMAIRKRNFILLSIFYCFSPVKNCVSACWRAARCQSGDCNILEQELTHSLIKLSRLVDVKQLFKHIIKFSSTFWSNPII